MQQTIGPSDDWLRLYAVEDLSFPGVNFLIYCYGVCGLL